MASQDTVHDLPGRLETLDEHVFYSKLAETSGISIAFFTKPGCSSCRAWSHLLAELITIRKDVSVFEVDAEQNMALSHEYELFHLPALFLFVDGEFHRELQSEARLPLLNKAIDVALESPAMEAP